MKFLQGNYVVIGVSEQKGDRSVTAVLERKSFDKRPFRSKSLERRGNGLLYGAAEMNRSNQTGSKQVWGDVRKLKSPGAKMSWERVPCDPRGRQKAR